MPLKVANVRLELDETELALPDKLAGRLGVGRDALARVRILRKSLDARRQDDLHFVYAAEVDLPDEEAGLIRKGLGRDVEPFQDEGFDWPPHGPGPSKQRPIVIGAGPAGLFAGYLLAINGYRPLVLERGRDVKDRVADVRAFDAGGPSIPRATTCSAKAGRARSAMAS